MRLGIRGKIFVVSLGLLVASLAAAEIYLVPTVERDLTERIRQDLHVRLHLIAERALGARAEGADWEGLADRLGPLAHARVTFIDATGAVAGDSEVAGERLAALENHRSRPEVAAAFAGRIADDIRYSASVHKRMLYAAAPVSGAPVMVARLSLPLSAVDLAKARMRVLFLGGAVVALLAAVLFSLLAAELLSRGPRHLTGIARRMAAGELEARARLESPDEIGELGRALDHLAATLARSLRELRDDRDLLGRILQSMREGVLVMDGERRILLANASLRDMLLLDSDVVGRSTIEVIRNADLQSLVERALAASQPMDGEIEVAGLKPRRMLVNAAPLSGEPRALLLVLFDVTEIRRLETVRRDFVANVSHELRTPVASVSSAAETLRTAMERDPKDAVQFVDMIERNARRLGELVSDLLDLSRIEAKEYRLEVRSLDLAAAIDGSVTAFAERAARRRIALAARLPATLGEVRADAVAVERVLANLLDNALKYCAERATVVVEVAEVEGGVQVRVSDTGPGIEGKHLPRLFERFYRVDPGRSRDMGGTGLGLSIVKHLVEAMGGEVTVESTPGQGTTFAFTLPRAS